MTKINPKKDNFLDSLKGDIDTIRANRFDLDGLAHQLEEVVNWCIDKHDESLKKLLEMEAFLEKNIDLFYRPYLPLVPRCTSNTNFGYKNPMNNVTIKVCNESTIVKIWIDHGLMFWYIPKTNRVTYIGHNLDEPARPCDRGECCNYEGQNHTYNFFDTWDDNGEYPKEGYDRFFIQPTSLVIDMNRVNSFEYVLELKKKVEDDHKNVLRTCQCLVDAVQDIRAKELEYYYNMEDMVDSTKPKKKKVAK